MNDDLPAVELTKSVIRIVHPLLNPLISTPEQGIIDFQTNPRFCMVCKTVVHFILSEKPDAEQQLLQQIEIDHFIRNTNLFLSQKNPAASKL